VNKTAASAAPLATCVLLCMLIHLQLLISSWASTNKNFI